MNEQIKKRLLSLFWRAGMMALAVIIDGIVVMLSDGTIKIDTTYVVLIGLVLGECSKAIRNSIVEK